MRIRAATGDTSSSGQPSISAPVRTTLDSGGRIVIPVEFRRALGVRAGDEVLLRFVDGEVHVYTFDQMTQAVQAWGAGLAPTERVISEEMIAERRAEAKSE